MLPPGTLPYPPTSPYSDAAITHWPSANFLRESVWLHGQWPLWNPLHMLGQPFAANPLNKVWYPPQWLVLLFPPTLHLDLLIYLHAGWSMVGMMLWARASKLHFASEIFAALSWCLAPKLIAHLGAGHLDLWYAAAWVPWLLWILLEMRIHATALNAITLGIVASMLVLADLRMAFYILPFGVVYSLLLPDVCSIFSKRKWQQWVASAIILIGLTAVQIIPLIALSPYLTRSQIRPDEAAAFSLPPSYLVGTIIANTSGFQEYLTYLGIPVIALAGLALRLRERRLIFGLWVMASIAGLWSLGSNGPIFLPLVHLIPGASWFRVPSRAWFVVILAFVLLAAHGMDDLTRHQLHTRERLFVVAIGFAGFIWMIGSWAMQESLPEHIRSALIGAGFALLITAAGLWIVGRGISHIPPQMASITGSGLLISTLAGSFVLLDKTLIEGRTLEQPDPAIAADSCSLIYSPSFDVIGPAYAHTRTLHGVDPFQFIWSADEIAIASGSRPDGYSVTAPPLPPDADDPATALGDLSPNWERLIEVGTVVVVSGFPITPEWGGVPTEIRAGLYKLDLPRNANMPMLLCSPGPNQYRGFVGTGPARTIPVSMAWAPGWKVRLNRNELKIDREGALMVVEVPDRVAGDLILSYEPLGDYIGMWVSGIAVALTAGWWIVHRKEISVCPVR